MIKSVASIILAAQFYIMAKEKTIFLCNDCGYESPKWAGKCPSCGAWNSLVEKRVRTGGSGGAAVQSSFSAQSQPVLIDTVSTDELPRISMGDAELDRVFKITEGIMRSLITDVEM